MADAVGVSRRFEDYSKLAKELDIRTDELNTTDELLPETQLNFSHILQELPQNPALKDSLADIFVWMLENFDGKLSLTDRAGIDKFFKVVELIQDAESIALHMKNLIEGEV